MKKIILALISLIFLFGCEDERMIYDGPWFARFELPAYQLSSDGEVRIPISLNTAPQDKAVTVSLEINSDLLEGTDFTVENLGTVVFEPGEYLDTIVIKGKDTYFVGKKEIQIRISGYSDPAFSTTILEQGSSEVKVDVTPSFLIESFPQDLYCDAASVWVGMDIVEELSNTFGMWYSDQVTFEFGVHLERKGQPIIGQEVDGVLQVALLNEGDVIDSNSSYMRDYYSEWWRIPTLSNSVGYTVWNGKTGYVGLELSVGGQPRYAWVKLSVAADGLSASIIEWAYELNGKAIKAGQK